MTLYSQYVLEREGKLVLEDERGFLTYGIYGDECFIEAAYIAPEYRKRGVGSFFTDEAARIAKENNCTYLSCNVCPSAKNATESMKAILAYGFKLHSSQANKISFIKELK